MAGKTPFGAKFALLVAALGLGAMLSDKKGLGQDPVVKTSTGMIGFGALLWAGWAALKNVLSRRA